MTDFTRLGLSLPVTAFAIASAAFLLVTLALIWAGVHFMSDGAFALALGSGAIAVLALILLAIAAWPLQPRYWADYGISGTIETVSNTWTEAGGDLARVPVITLDSTDAVLVVSDPRIITLEGERVDLVCQAEWVYRAADRFNCRIARVLP